ncbi:MAG: aldo/keto reductase [Gemmatimonadaceae bacterium]|nr:aldo/keto reductase [Gemmatimonadaceae bacterium]
MHGDVRPPRAFEPTRGDRDHPRGTRRGDRAARHGRFLRDALAAPARHHYIDIYRLSRVDSTVPIEETVGAIAEMIAKGYVRHVGLSDAGTETIRRPRRATDIRRRS